MPTPPHPDRGSVPSTGPRADGPVLDGLDDDLDLEHERVHGPTSEPSEPFVLDAPSARSGLRRRGLALGAVVATAVLASGAVVGVWASAADPGTNLRTATVATRSVAQTIDAVATVEPVTQASLAFPVSGTVATVAVADGDTVTTGQVLATLDGSTLQASINTANATLAQARLSLQQALNGETVSGSGSGAAGGSGSAATGASGSSSPSASSSSASSSSGSGSGTTGSTGSSAPGGVTGTGASTGGSGSSDEIVTAQQAVVAAQATVDDGLVEVSEAMTNADQVCTALGSAAATPAASTTPTTPTTLTTPTGPSGTPGTPGGPAAANAAPSTTYTTTVASTSATSDAATLTACQTALGQVLTAQQALADQQAALDQSVRALTALLDASVTATATTGSGSGTTATTAATSGTSSASAATTTGSTTTATAAELIAYQKAVDAAEVGVAVAEQALQQAIIVSPIDGTVVSLGLEVGDPVTAASTTAVVVIAGGDGFELTTSVAVTDLPDIEVGQPVTIRPDSSTTDLTGQVVRVGVTPGASSTTSYPVTIGVTGDTSGLRNGSTASVSIVTDDEQDSIAVPASAVTVTGDRSTVTILADGQTRQVQVEVGAVGASWIAVTDGVTVGQTVVLADLGQALPGTATDGSAATTTNRGGAALTRGGNFPGGPPPG